MLQQGNEQNWNSRYHGLCSELQSAGERGSELLALARSLIPFWEQAEFPASALKECVKHLPERVRCRIANIVIREATSSLTGVALDILIDSPTEGPRYLQPLLNEGSHKFQQVLREEVERLEGQRDLAVGKDRIDTETVIRVLTRSGVTGFFANEETRCGDRLGRLRNFANGLSDQDWKVKDELAACLVSLALHGEKHHWQSSRDVFRNVRDSADCTARTRAELALHEAIEIVRIYQAEAQSKKSHKLEAQAYAAGLKRLEEWHKTWTREASKGTVRLPRAAPIDELKLLLSGDTKRLGAVRDRIRQLSATLKDEANQALSDAIGRAVECGEIQTLTRYLLPALRSGCTVSRLEILRSLAQRSNVKYFVGAECFELLCGVEDVIRPTQDVRQAAKALIKHISEFGPIFRASLDDQMRFIRGINGAYSHQDGFFFGESELREFCNTHVVNWPERKEAFRFLQVCQRSGVIGRTAQQFGKKPELLCYDNFLRGCTPGEISSLTAEYPETLSLVIDALRRPGFTEEQISAAVCWVVTGAKRSQTLWWHTAKSVQATPLPIETAFVREYFARGEWSIGFMLGLRMVIESEAANADEDLMLRTAIVSGRFSEARPDAEWIMHKRGEELMRIIPAAERAEVLDFAEKTVRHTWGDIPFVMRIWERVSTWFKSNLPELPLARGTKEK